MAGEIITDDGVLIEQTDSMPVLATDGGTIATILRAELDTQIMTARQYPRSLKNVMNNIYTLATLDEETATECVYAVRRGGKPLRGPSIRLAEVISSQWGNCRDGAQVVSIDRANKLIVAEGFFHDLETNRGTKTQVQRRISDKYGKLFSDDMIAVTGNAACAIARRNAILAGIPKGIWRKAFDACEQIIRGDASTMVEKRDRALLALSHFNVAPEQIFALMDVGGIDDLTLDDIATLRVIYMSLKNGEQTVEELLRTIEPEKKERATPQTAKMTAPDVFDDSDLPSPAKKQEKKKTGDGKPPPAASALPYRFVRKHR